MPFIGPITLTVTFRHTLFGFVKSSLMCLSFLGLDNSLTDWHTLLGADVQYPSVFADHGCGRFAGFNDDGSDR